MKISRRHGNAVEIRDIYGPAVFGDLSAELQPFFIVCPDVVTAPQSRHGGRLGCGRESGKLQGDDSGVRKILWGVPIKALHLGNVEFVLCERSGYPVCRRTKVVASRKQLQDFRRGTTGRGMPGHVSWKRRRDKC